MLLDPRPHFLLPLLMAVWVAMGGPARSEQETADRFLNKLIEQGHTEQALQYLERAPDNPLVSERFKQRTPVLRLKVLAGQAEAVTDLEKRSAALRRVAQQIEQEARGGLVSEELDALKGDVLARQATVAANAARRDALAARQMAESAERRNALTAARTALADAQRDLLSAAGLAERELSQLKVASADSIEGERRKELSARLAVVELLAARLEHERAETYPPSAAERNQLNTQAAKRFRELYEKRSRQGAGLMAHLYEGRCYRLLGEVALARAAFEDLTAQPATTAELRRIVTQAYAELAALFTGDGKPEQALVRPAEWLAGLPAPETIGPAPSTLRYYLAEAALAQAETKEGAEARRLKTQARDWLADAWREPSEVQAAAREAWVRVTSDLGIEKKQPKSFDEAFATGRQAFDALRAAGLASEDGEAQKQESRAAAIEAFTIAMRLAGPDDDPAEVSRARYWLAYLYYDAQDDHRAAVISEYVTRSLPEDDSAEDCARLALAALERLRTTVGGGAESDAVGERLRSLALLVASRWNEGPTSETAYAVLLNDALQSDDPSRAEELLANVSGPRRDKLALRYALVLWEKTRKAGSEERRQALARLRDAFEAIKNDSESASASLRTASLYLAQAALEAGDARRAISLLEDSKHGPLAVSAATPDELPRRVEALKTLVRAQAQRGSNPSEAIDKLVSAIEKSRSAQPDREWLVLALQLFEDMKQSKSTGAAATLGKVLDRLDGTKAAADWNTLLWIAQARLRVGEALDADNGRKNLEAGRDLFAELIKRSEAEPGFAPSATSVLAAKLQRAECDRALGEYESAIEAFAGLLGERRSLLDVQKAAAEALHQWGVASEDPTHLEEAIAGTRRGSDGKNIIWGWTKLAAIAARAARSDPNRRDLFFEAWLGVARSRHEAAMLAQGSARDEQLNKAAKTIRTMQRQYPDLGGATRRAQFEALLERIESDAEGSSFGFRAASAGANP